MKRSIVAMAEMLAALQVYLRFGLEFLADRIVKVTGFPIPSSFFGEVSALQALAVCGWNTEAFTQALVDESPQSNPDEQQQHQHHEHKVGQKVGNAVRCHRPTLRQNRFLGQQPVAGDFSSDPS
jgi:hypothetical protein